MIWDQPRQDGPGAYGEGLAAPLGEMRWLGEIRGPVTFRSLRLGEYGDLRFPYHLLKHELGLAPDPVFQHLTQLAKVRVGAQGAGPRVWDLGSAGCSWPRCASGHRALVLKLCVTL